ncbi:MAG TPA: potassium ABC transporter ATPase [Anaerolineae bacterium]|nr:potassium ABC transporter ATPase [Anaerolineae bacterium]
MDIVYVGITLVFFALSWGLLKLCERLMGGEA